MSRYRYGTSSSLSSRSNRLYADDFLTDETSVSPLRATGGGSGVDDLAGHAGAHFYDYYDPDASLRLKWMDNSPRMSRLREHRQKRLINRLEVR